MVILDASNLDFACNTLINNNLLAFPTETVYGLGGNAYSDEAVAKIFECKNRPQFNPISVCYPSFDCIHNDVKVNDIAKSLAKEFLPGSLTLILKRKPNCKISWLCSGGKDSIGIRIPSNETAIKLLSRLEFPLAAPSANRSSDLSTTTAQDVCNSLKDYDNLVVLDDGPCRLGIESTIIDVSEGTPKLLREGAIAKEDIEIRCGISLISGVKPKVSHYKPTKPLIINIDNTENIKENDALLAFGKPLAKAKYSLNLSKNANLLEAAQNLFSMLRSLDKTPATRICVMKIPNNGIGKAVNDRLQQAAFS